MMYRGFRQRTRWAAGRMFALLLFLAIAGTVATGWCQAETTVSASLNPAQFSMDAGAALTVTVNGSRSADVHLPSVPGLSFQGRGKSTQIQMINGSFSSSLSMTYLVQAERPGKYTIPPISVSVDGSTLTTRPISLEVTQGGTPNQGPAAPPTATRLRAGEADKVAFLRISEVKDSSWIGEVVPIRIKAYFRQGIRASLNALPVINDDGFVMPQLDQKPHQTEENVNGTLYSVLTWDSSLSAVKEGRHTLTVELEATLLLPQRRRNPFPGFGDQDLFQDDFFQNFFGGFESKIVKVASKPITIEARQLPAANQPPDYSGAIGHFNLSVQSKPTQVEVGDPITLTMTVSGNGNFDRVETPKFPEDPSWKTYPPSAEFKQGDSPSKGSKKFEQAIVVKDDRVTEIPPVSFVFFNPETEKYVTLKSEAIPLSVQHSKQEAASASAVPAPPAAAAKVEPESRGIAGLAPIHLQMGSLQKKITPLFARVWFDLLLALCAVLLLAVFLWKARLRYLHNNPELCRKKEMHELLARNMALIDEAANSNDSRHYLATCRKAIQELLGRHWQIEPSAITLADLQTRLQPPSGLITIFAAAEQGAYADFTLSPAQIRQYAEQIRKELSELP
jgi:hypothetical protein